MTVHSWHQLKRIEKEYGQTYYFLDLPAFKKNYQEFLNAFRYFYPNSNVAYSYKTNYLPRICQSVNSLGGYAEVVSGMEYELARRIGVDPSKIIFNGPYKSEDDIDRALTAGSLVNLDAAYEVDFVEKIAGRRDGKRLRTGIRCNFDVGTDQPSRFGFDINDDQFALTVERIRSIVNCDLEGIHCHFLTRERGVDDYVKIARRMIDIARNVFPERPPRFINLGGGFFSKMEPELKAQFPFPIPDYRDYAAAIGNEFKSSFLDQYGPKLILEPGIALTADVMTFVTKVVDIKRVQHRNVALVSGSVYNIKPTKSTRNLPVEIIRKESSHKGQKQRASIDIVGYTCMEDDCLYRDFSRPLSVGDYILFRNVGAYTLVLKPPFIQPSPAVLVCDEDGKVQDVIKHPEEFQNVFATYTY